MKTSTVSISISTPKPIIILEMYLLFGKFKNHTLIDDQYNTSYLDLNDI